MTATYSGDSRYPGYTRGVEAQVIAAQPIGPAGTFDAGDVNIGNSSTAFPVNVTFRGSATLGQVAVLTQGIQNLDFVDAGSGTCAAGNSYAANTTCTVNVTFRPQSAGTIFGAVVLQRSGGNVLGTAYLRGNGVGPQAVFQAGTHSALEEDFLSPSGVAADLAGNLYLTDSGDLCSPNGIYRGHVVKQAPLSDGHFRRTAIGQNLLVPVNSAVDGSGNVYIADVFSMAIYKETLQVDGTYV